MLILTIAMNIHLAVRYKQLCSEMPNSEQSEIVFLTTQKMVWPCLYTALTTICAFTSLVFSGIKPVIDFGWMMSLGLITSFIITFTLFPTLLNFLSTEKVDIKEQKKQFKETYNQLLDEKTTIQIKKKSIEKNIITLSKKLKPTDKSVEDIDNLKENKNILSETLSNMISMLFYFVIQNKIAAKITRLYQIRFDWQPLWD